MPTTTKEELLIAFYKARQERLRRIEEANGPLLPGSTQHEPSVTVGEANAYLQLSTEDLNEVPRLIPALVEAGWVRPEGSQSTEGLYYMVTLTPHGIQRVRELVA